MWCDAKFKVRYLHLRAHYLDLREQQAAAGTSALGLAARMHGYLCTNKTHNGCLRGTDGVGSPVDRHLKYRSLFVCQYLLFLPLYLQRSKTKRDPCPSFQSMLPSHSPHLLLHTPPPPPCRHLYVLVVRTSRLCVVCGKPRCRTLAAKSSTEKTSSLSYRRGAPGTRRPCQLHQPEGSAMSQPHTAATKRKSRHCSTRPLLIDNCGYRSALCVHTPAQTLALPTTQPNTSAFLLNPLP